METNRFPHTKTSFCLSVPSLFVQLALSIFPHNPFPISPHLKIFPTIPSANAIPKGRPLQTSDSRPSMSPTSACGCQFHDHKDLWGKIKRPWIPMGPRSVIGFIKLEDSTYCNNWHIVYRTVCDTVAFVCRMYNSSVSCVNTYVT